MKTLNRLSVRRLIQHSTLLPLDLGHPLLRRLHRRGHAPAVDRPRSTFPFCLDCKVKLLQSVRLKHSEHVRKLLARDLQRQVERRKMLGSKEKTRVRRLRLHRSWSKDQYNAGPCKPRIRGGERCRHDDVAKFNRPPAADRSARPVRS